MAFLAETELRAVTLKFLERNDSSGNLKMKETLVIGTNVICVTFCDRERNSRIHLWRVTLRKQPCYPR